MRHLVVPFTLLVFVACDPEPTGSPAGVEVSDASLSACEDSGLASGEITVDPAGVGGAHVEHHTSLACCIDGVDVTVAVSGSTVTAEYAEKGDPCDCMCVYVVSYDLHGLSAGDWTVTAGADSGTVTVE